MSNIFSAIVAENHARLQHTAIIDGTLRISYEELFTGAQRVAETLAAKGIVHYSRVGLLCEDCIDYVIASLAILSLPAVIVPISPDQSQDEIDAVITRIDLDFLIVDAKLKRSSGCPPLDPAGFVVKKFTILARPEAATPPKSFLDLNPAFIRFSSGTTGASKGVVLSHETILARTDAADKGLKITADDTVLWVLSMSFHFVVTILLFLRRGATIVLCGKQLPHALIDGINNHKGTFIYASPFHYSLLAGSGDIADDALKNVRMAISTAMKLPDQVSEDFSRRFGMELTEAYGIIEAGLPFIRLAGNAKKGSVGNALPGYLLRLDNTDENGIGDILIQGAGLLDAYYSPWQERGEILTDGWFATGDLGRIDADGCLFIAGRKKDVINFVGMKIFSQEVETVINSFPGVLESLVYPLPHERFGEIPAVKVVLVEGMDRDAVAEDLQRFCYQHLSSYKVPKDYEFVAELPKTPSGKIRR